MTSHIYHSLASSILKILITTTIAMFGMIAGPVAHAQSVPVVTVAVSPLNSPFNAKVIGVIDGDTIRVLVSDDIGQKTIRLYGIDAPEKKQKHGSESKQAMSDLVFNKTVTVFPISVDIYGRTIAKVFVEKTDIGLSMVCDGHAWWYCQYAKRDSQLARCQKSAKQKHIGIWADGNPVAPWDFRKRKTSGNISN